MTNSKTCISCGAPIGAGAQTCPYCGAVVPKEVKQYAPTTMEPLYVQQQSTPQRVKKHDRDKTTAALLAFFLGGIGGDQFYIGNIAWGVVFLLFCWTFIPCIVALVNFIRYLSMSQAEFDNKYNY